MPAKYVCTIPRPAGNPLQLTLQTGESIIIVGANGAGKTRLGVLIEGQIHARKVQRIAAQKSLALSDTLSIVSFERATNLLQFGFLDGTEGHKASQRWGNKPATHFLSDFDALLQSLFAKHNRIATEHLLARKSNPDIPVPVTELEKLKTIWDLLLPHRILQIFEASIRVSPPNSTNIYAGSEMSDGERAIFYFIGQSLLAPEDGVIIIDEPEAHIHRAILAPLWDAIEKARPDCCYVYITHDLDFAATHNASNKYFIRDYCHTPLQWGIDEIPEDTGLPEQVVVELVGSRRPILFVEGERGSLDLTIYRSLYGAFTIMPIGSCEAVIHSVASYRGATTLHWLKACGLVDGDDRSVADIENLGKIGVYVLPVAEVENLVLLPPVFIALAEALLCADPADRLKKLKSDVMTEASNNLDEISARFTIRQLDRRLKKIGINAKELSSLKSEFQTQITQIDPAAAFSEFRSKLQEFIQTDNLVCVLQRYDNKGLLAKAAQHLGIGNQRQLLEKLGRLLSTAQGAKVREELAKALPQIPS